MGDFGLGLGFFVISLTTSTVSYVEPLVVRCGEVVGDLEVGFLLDGETGLTGDPDFLVVVSIITSSVSEV